MTVAGAVVVVGAAGAGVAPAAVAVAEVSSLTCDVSKRSNFTTCLHESSAATRSRDQPQANMCLERTHAIMHLLATPEANSAYAG